jgi:cation transport regulator ChaC
MSLDIPELKVGILAYGSLIDDPGPEIEPCIAMTLRGLETPFNVEYARSSQSRGGGPSLVPVDTGGGKVVAVIHVLKRDVSVEQATDWLWRREVRKYGAADHYVPTAQPGKNKVVIETLADFRSVRAVLFTWIGANISPLNAHTLGRLAVQSAQTKTVKAGKDGISYLLNAKRQGIVTPLTAAYEQEILSLTNTTDLATALSQARQMGMKPTVADRADVVRAFCEDCVWTRAVRTHFLELFEVSDERRRLLAESANTFFHDLNTVLLEYVLLQQHKLVDQASSGTGKDNLTSNYLVGLEWSEETKAGLKTENAALLGFREKIADARRKLIAHTDLRARLGVNDLGSFLQAEEAVFWDSLQRFVSLIHEEAIGGPFEIDASMPDGDAATLIHRLADAVDYDDLMEERPDLLRERIGKKRFNGS